MIQHRSLHHRNLDLPSLSTRSLGLPHFPSKLCHSNPSRPPNSTTDMKSFSVALLGAVSIATCALASGSNVNPTYLEKRMRPSRVLHAPPSKRSPATDDVQASIVAQAANDPVGAAVAAQGLDGVRNNVDGGDLSSGTLISGDSETSTNPQDNQYSWNQNVQFAPNANAIAGTGNETGWTALPDLEGFDLIRNRVVVENATQPYYVTSGYNAALIKKAIIVMPGKVS